MSAKLRDEQMALLCKLVSDSLGLYFPPKRWPDLERQATLAAKEFGFTDIGPFIEWIRSAPLTKEQIEALAGHLTIAETYFWREPHAIEAFRDKILPELIRSRENGDRRLRLWSAACASGEEPYSIAIALREALPNIQSWNVTLLATDISPRILRRAAAGVYGEWSFRNVPPKFKEKHFRRRDDGKYEILPEIREMVTFAYLNLAEDTFPTPTNNTNAMDLIFCRNVLMYFEQPRARLVGQRLYKSLVPGGWLMVGATELSQGIFPDYATVHFPGAIAYRREAEQQKRSAKVSAPAARRKKIAPAPQPRTAPATRQSPAAPKPRSPAKVAPKDTGTNGEATESDVVLQVRALANEGNLDLALASCETAIAADKLSPGLHYLNATILQEQGREIEAAASLKRALYLDPNFALAHFVLGNLCQRRGDTTGARRSFGNASEILKACEPDEPLPEAEGLTAGRLSEIVRATLQAGVSSS